MSSTTILNDILEKLSILTKEDELAQDISEVEVKEEVIEAKEDLAKEEVKEETTELSEEPTESVEEVEASEEVETQENENLAEGYVSEEKYLEDMSRLKAEIDAIKKMIDEEMGYMKKEKQALSEQVEELSKEPAAEAIKHNPEEGQAKKLNFAYGQNKPQTTFDRVMARINNKQ
jgi:hypothetical protein